MTTRHWRVAARIFAGCLAAGALLGTAGRPAATTASWGDTEVATGTFAAKTVQRPVIADCTLVPGTGGLFPVITIHWKFAANSGYSTPNNASYAVAKGGLPTNLVPTPIGTDLTTTGPDSNLSYTTKYGSGILSGLLGGSYLVAVRAVDNGWTSPYSTALASMGIAGTNPKCTVQP